MIRGLSRVLRFLPSVTAALLFLLFAAAPGTGAPLPPLRVVMDDSYPPYVFRESDNTLSGILVDQWKLWSEKTGRRVQVTGIPWGEALRRMEAGEFDVIDTIFRTSDRERRFDFTPPYARIDVPLFFHSDITGIQDAHDAKGFMVAVKRGDAVVEILREAGVGSLVEYPGYAEIVDAARDGRVRVFTIDRPPALYFLNKSGIADRFRETKPIYVGEFHRAVRKGDAATLAAVSDGFGRISRAEFDRIDRRWSGSPLAGWLTPGRMRWAGGGFAVVALSMAAWLVTMRRIVESRTRQLHASETRYRLLVENQTDLVVQVDMEGRFQFVNEAYCRMFDKTREELLGRTFMPLVHEEDRDSTSRAMEGLDRHPYHVYLEQRAMTKDGWRWLAWVDTALRGRDGEMIAIHGIGRDITPRKEAEIALRESEGRFRNAIDFLPIPIGISSADGEILTINQEFTRRFGYTLEDIPTIDAWLALAYPDPAYRERVASNWRRDIAMADREGSATPVREYGIACLDGETREVEIRTQTVGKQLVTAFNDITELRAHEREIVRLNRIYATRSQISQCVTRVRSAEELYLEACRVTASTGRFALAWIGLVDRGTGEVKVAAKAGKAAGYLEGIRISADDRPEGAGPMGTCIRKGRTYVCNDFANNPATHLWADRVRRFGLRSAVAVPLRMGDAVYGAMMAYSEEAGVFHEKEIALLEEATLDISFGLEFLEHDRKRGLAEERLRESRERVGLILDSAAEGIYGVDREGGCTFCNASALRMLGYPEEGALLGRNLHALIRHTDEQGAPCPAGDGADWRATWMGEHAHLDRVLLWRSDGTSFLGEMWAYPLLGEGGNAGAVVTFVDISKRVALEDQLLQAQKMEAVGRLAGGVAHDFNNLLTAILGYGALATRKAAGNVELLRDLEQIRLAGDQAASLTRQLLAFSRKQILRPRVISLAGVVREIQAMIGRLLGEDIALVVDAPAGTGFIEAIRGRSTRSS